MAEGFAEDFAEGYQAASGFDRPAGGGSDRPDGEGTPRPELYVLPGGYENLIADESWHDRALCSQTDPEAFFPEKGGSTREAKRICIGCDVKAECLDYALENDERFGIWGGLSERERRRIKRGI